MQNAKLFRYLVAAAFTMLCLPAMAQPALVGWVEPITLESEGMPLSAKLDTGADTSSLHARDITWISRPDGDWVAFDIVGENDRSVRLERKVQRIAHVKKASGGVQSRPTVLLGVCLGGVYRMTEVNLTDRTGFKLPVLLGRSFLGGDFAVDSSRTRTIEPKCRTTTASAAGS
jgi:hypothetical protein